MKIKRIFRLIFFLVICQLAGLAGSLVTTPAISTWYTGLNKPSFNPPSWLFAPVWTALYFLMGVSAYLVWSKGLKDKKVRTALFLFALQLVFNVLWSFLFFGLRSPLLALIEIIIFWVAILLTILSFFKISKPAGFLLLPYLLWVSFATLLNFFILQLNK